MSILTRKADETQEIIEKQIEHVGLRDMIYFIEQASDEVDLLMTKHVLKELKGQLKRNKAAVAEIDSLLQEIEEADKPVVKDTTRLGKDTETRSRLEQIENMSSQIETEMYKRHHQANAGIASAIAAASLPQPYRPGASMVGIGLGTHGGESAFAVGVSHISIDGRWLFKLNSTANTRGKLGGGINVGYHW